MTHTTRQQRFMEALTAKIQELDDPEPDIITNEGYKYDVSDTKKDKRQLPKIIFKPYGKDSKIKAEIMRSAELGDIADLEQKKAEWKKKTGHKVAQDKEDYILARRFNSYWIKYWAPIAKAIEILQDPQQRFTKPDQTVAEPIRLLMRDKIPATPVREPEKPESDTEKPYNDVLAEHE